LAGQDEETRSQYEQRCCEDACEPFLAKSFASTRLKRKEHVAYLLSGLEGLPAGYVSLDASRTWLVYWSVHALDLLGHELPEAMHVRIVGTPCCLVPDCACGLVSILWLPPMHFSQTSWGGVFTPTGASAVVLSRHVCLCRLVWLTAILAFIPQSVSFVLTFAPSSPLWFQLSRFAKSPAFQVPTALCRSVHTHPLLEQLRCTCYALLFPCFPPQLGHCAPTYSAVLALLILGSRYPAAYPSIPRARLYSFFLRMKQENGGFCMHDGGETDVRGTYTVIAIATLLNMLTPQLSEGVKSFVLRSAQLAAFCELLRECWVTMVACALYLSPSLPLSLSLSLPLSLPPSLSLSPSLSLQLSDV
jgi:hypothetical protein